MKMTDEEKIRFYARYSSVANLQVCRPFRSHGEFSFFFLFEVT